MLPGSEPIKIYDTKTDQEFLLLAYQRFNYGWDYWRPNYQAAQEDLEFTYIDQWSKEDRKARKGRPCLSLNKLPTYLDQVMGDQRQNRPSIVVHPVNGDKPDVQQQPAPRQGMDPAQQMQGPPQQQPPPEQNKVKNIAGTKDYSESEIRNGIIRNIEQISNADLHYDMAFQHAIEGGFGWLRLITAYSTEDTFDQDLLIKSVRDRFSVIIDPQAISEPDFSCADWCFISEIMRRKEFQARYPDAVDSAYTTSMATSHPSWHTEEMVRISEYFWREPVDRSLVLLSDGRVTFMDKIKDVVDDLVAEGIHILKERKVKTYKVMWAKITAQSILERPQEVPFETIPIVPVLGKEVTIGDNVYFRGLVRYAKDAQRMHNYWMSAATERVALAPKSPWVADAKSIMGYENMWENANWENASVLKYNHRPDVPAPARVQPPSMPSAELNLAMSAVDEIKATVGLFDASMGQQGNEISGKAIIARQRQGDRGTFAFIDNLSRAMRRIGKLLIYSIAEVYDSDRVIRLKFNDGKGDWVTINESILDHKTGKVVQIHDISAGKFDCTVTVGPSYQTQRTESAEALIQFMQAVPAAAQVIPDLVANNMDFPGAEEIAKRLQKTLPPGILSPQEQQDAGIQPPQPTPADQAAMAKIQAEMATAHATESMAQAKTLEAQVKIKELKMMAQQANPANMADAVRNLIAESLAEIMAKPQGAGQQPQPQQQQQVPMQGDAS